MGGEQAQGPWPVIRAICPTTPLSKSPTYDMLVVYELWAPGWFADVCMKPLGEGTSQGQGPVGSKPVGLRGSGQVCLDIQGPEDFVGIWLMNVQKIWLRMQS